MSVPVNFIVRDLVSKHTPVELALMLVEARTELRVANDRIRKQSAELGDAARARARDDVVIRALTRDNGRPPE